MEIYVLGLLGSPRAGGNSDLLLDSFLAGAQESGGETEKLILNELQIRPCQECGGCDGTGICIQEDRMREVYPKLEKAHIVAVASPIFFSGVTAQLKAMIDRCQCNWVRRYRLGRPPQDTPSPQGHKDRLGVFLSVRGQMGRGIFDAAGKVVRAFFATEGFSYAGELFVDGLDNLGAILSRPEALGESRALGQKLVNKLIPDYS